MQNKKKKKKIKFSNVEKKNIRKVMNKKLKMYFQRKKKISKITKIKALNEY